MEDFFTEVARDVGLLLEFLSVVIIAVGSLAALYRFFYPWTLDFMGHGRLRLAWVVFARWMLLGLEFTLAADIVHSAVTPTWDRIGQLAAVAVIRTFLNYFLSKDLENTLGTEKIIAKEKI